MYVYMYIYTHDPGEDAHMIFTHTVSVRADMYATICHAGQSKIQKNRCKKKVAESEQLRKNRVKAGYGVA